jgi:hypothetical protein
MTPPAVEERGDAVVQPLNDVRSPREIGPVIVAATTPSCTRYGDIVSVLSVGPTGGIGVLRWKATRMEMPWFG